MVGLSPFAIAPAYGSMGVPVGAASATPDYSVALFADLPADATVGQRVAVTGESGLSGVVCVNTAANTWEVDTVTATYDLIAAVEWGTVPGTWYSSGGISVTTASGCEAIDTTNKIVWIWDAANTQFVNPTAYMGTIAGTKKIKGDSVAPADWVVTTAPGSGGTSTVTTSAGVLRLTAIQPGPGNTWTYLTLTNSSFSAAGNIYLKAMAQVVTSTGHSLRVGFVIADGTDAYDFGSSLLAAVANATGQWFNQDSNGAAYTFQSGAQLGLSAAMVLVEILKIGTRCAVRVAGGNWLDILGSTARTAGGFKIVQLIALSVPYDAVPTTTVFDVQHLSVMSF